MARFTFFCVLFFSFSLSISAQKKDLEPRPDLRIDSVAFLERSGFLPFLNQGKPLLSFFPLKPRKLFLQFTITNIGDAPANLLGEGPTKLDNVAVRGYFSGDKKLNKGDFLAGGTFIPNDSPEKGILAPNSSLSGFLKVSLKNKSRYIGVLILKVDDLNVLDEEDETNNTFSIVVGKR